MPYEFQSIGERAFSPSHDGRRFSRLPRFEILAYTVFLNYQNTLLFTREEFGVVVVGPMTNIVIFALLIMASWASQRTFGSFPNLLSRFVIAFGIETALDPILIFVVDAAMMRYENQSGKSKFSQRRGQSNRKLIL